LLVMVFLFTFRADWSREGSIPRVMEWISKVSKAEGKIIPKSEGEWILLKLKSSQFLESKATLG
jgi:hypothetical protein